MNITEAQYVKDEDDKNVSITATIDGKVWHIGIEGNEGNRHYVEIQRQVDAGTLTIKDAD